MLRRQVDIALALGCERCIVVSQGLPERLVEIQHLVEGKGRKFHAIAGPRALSGLVSTADELLVFGDGVVPDEAHVRSALADHRGVFVLPADPAVSQGFERIDRSHAWAGVLRTRGSDAARLTDLPSDIDPISALMRLAVQSGRPILELPGDCLTDGRWLLVRSSEHAQTAGHAIARATIPRAGWSAPFSALADRLVLARAGSLPDAAKPARSLQLAGAILLAIALAIGWNAYPALALAALALAAFASRAGRSLARFGGPGRAWLVRYRETIALGLFDAALVAVLAWGLPPNAWKELLFPLAMMLGLLRLGEQGPARWLAAMCRDRALLATLLAVAVGFGRTTVAIQSVAVVILVLLLLVALRTRLTRA